MEQERTNASGRAWLALLGGEISVFERAFAPDATLTGSVLRAAVVGPAAIRIVFDAARTMYDAIAFVDEALTAQGAVLLWRGGYAGAPVAGATVIERNAAGLIRGVRLLHEPYDQIMAFSAELASRLALETGGAG